SEKPTKKSSPPQTTAAKPTEVPTAAPTEEPTVEPTAEPSPLPTSPPPRKEASAEELKLIGVVHAGSTPSAVIAFGDQQEIFRKGDSVFDHGTIKEVRDDSVVVHSGDTDTTLRLAAPPAPQPTEQPDDSFVESRPPPVQVAPAPPSNQSL